MIGARPRLTQSKLERPHRCTSAGQALARFGGVRGPTRRNVRWRPSTSARPPLLRSRALGGVLRVYLALQVCAIPPQLARAATAASSQPSDVRHYSRSEIRELVRALVALCRDSEDRLSRRIAELSLYHRLLLICWVGGDLGDRMAEANKIGSFQSLRLVPTDNPDHDRFINALLEGVEGTSVVLPEGMGRDEYVRNMRERAHANCSTVLTLVREHLQEGSHSRAFIVDALQSVSWGLNEGDYDKLAGRFNRCSDRDLKRTMLGALLAHSWLFRAKAEHLCTANKGHSDPVIADRCKEWLTENGR